jgi:hypothetical protein
VRFERIWCLALLAITGACASAKPHVYGQFNDLAPRVAATQGERSPQHLTVQLARPANVAVFLVVPGRASVLLFPADSTQSQYIEQGSHLVQTAAAKGALSDTSRLVRIPQGGNRQPSRTGGRGAGNYPRDSTVAFGFNQHGYLLVFASQQPMPYHILATRVGGISVPIDDDDALNTVTKLIRETTQIAGPWAAYATDFPP